MNSPLTSHLWYTLRPHRNGLIVCNDDVISTGICDTETDSGSKAQRVRLTPMSVMTAEPNLELRRRELRRLDDDYRNAWKRFRAEVRAWQALMANGVYGTATEKARDRVESAETWYREQRNKLTDGMFLKFTNACALRMLPISLLLVRQTSVAQNVSAETFGRRQSQVKRLAYQFWEEGGRKNGNAEADWYRAEALTAR